MSYYANKRAANILITEMANKNSSVSEMIDKISLKFGFGKKAVLDRLEVMENLGFIIVDGEEVKTV